MYFDLNFWNYCIIINFLLSLSSFQTVLHIPPTLLLIHWLFFHCYYMHIYVCIYVYAHIFLNYKLLSSHYITYMMYAFRSDTGWHWTFSWWGFPWGRPNSSCQFSSAAYSSLCWVEASWVFLSLLWHVHWCHSCSANVWAITLIILMVIAYAVTRKHNPKARYPIFWLLQHTYPLFL